MSIGAIFFFGVFISLLFLGATILLVLSEAADPDTADDKHLNEFEKKMIGEKRKRKKKEQTSKSKA